MTGSTVADDDLVAYADGRLDPDRRAAIEAWLANHPKDRARVEGWQRQNAMLRTALDPVAEEPVPAELVRALRRKPTQWIAPAPAAAAAAVIAFAVGLATGHVLWNLPPERDVVQLASAGIDAHRIYAVEIRHPVEVGADEEQHLVTWLTKRLDTQVKAPDLSAEGLRLLGGRLIPSGDKPAALLMYEGENGERVTLLIERAAPRAMTAFRYAEAGAIGAFYWIDGGAGYALSGPANRVRLLRIANRVYEQLEN